jgi:hypothetical protein
VESAALGDVLVRGNTARITLAIGKHKDINGSINGWENCFEAVNCGGERRSASLLNN